MIDCLLHNHPSGDPTPSRADIDIDQGGRLRRPPPQDPGPRPSDRRPRRRRQPQGPGPDLSVEQRLALVTLLVRDYDEALAFYLDRLGFRLVEDRPLGPDKRWVVIAPPGAETGAHLLLAKASTPEQLARVGDQTGGRVAFFLHTDDFARDYARMTAAGVRFREPPRTEVYGTVAVFEDLYGNAWDLLQPR